MSHSPTPTRHARINLEGQVKEIKQMLAAFQKSMAAPSITTDDPLRCVSQQHNLKCLRTPGINTLAPRESIPTYGASNPFVLSDPDFSPDTNNQSPLVTSSVHCQSPLSVRAVSTPTVLTRRDSRHSDAGVHPGYEGISGVVQRYGYPEFYESSSDGEGIEAFDLLASTPRDGSAGRPQVWYRERMDSAADAE